MVEKMKNNNCNLESIAKLNEYLELKRNIIPTTENN
jgi:hypothetical protein